MGVRVLLIVLLAITSFRASGADASVAPTPTVSPNSIVAAIPFRLHQGYVVLVRGSVGGRRNLNMMVDTGARPSVIDSKLARQLGINGSAARMAVSHGTVPVQRAEVPSLEIGPVRKTKLSVVVADLANLRAHLGVDIDAVVGLDVLGGTSFALDYERKQIVFGVSEAATAVPYTPDRSLIVVPLQAGGRELRVLLDTGTAGLLLFKNPACSRIPGITFVSGADLRNIGGWTRVDRVTIDEVAFGGRKLGKTAAMVSDHQPAGTTFDGVLGPASLRLKKLTFDVEHHLIGLER